MSLRRAKEQPGAQKAVPVRDPAILVNSAGVRDVVETDNYAPLLCTLRSATACYVCSTGVFITTKASNNAAAPKGPTFSFLNYYLRKKTSFAVPRGRKTCILRPGGEGPPVGEGERLTLPSSTAHHHNHRDSQSLPSPSSRMMRTTHMHHPPNMISCVRNHLREAAAAPSRPRKAKSRRHPHFFLSFRRKAHKGTLRLRHERNQPNAHNNQAEHTNATTI